MSNAEADRKPAAVGRVLLALQKAREQLGAAERAQREPIAIVGVGCRYPGGVDGPQSFWRLLSHGVEAISDFPAERFDLERYYHPEPGQPGRISFRRGGFLGDIKGFDAAYFGISPREARDMDPQHRLLLEVSTEALQRATLALDQLRGSRTGVFIGITQNDYGNRFLRHDHPERITVYSGTGNLFSFAAGRLSHALGLRGPSIAVDTACSSSLVAVHLACQSLRCRESDTGIAGGAHLVLGPEISIFLSQSHAVSPDGRCRAFDAAASGFNRGEGCGIVVLKRLSDALAERHSILALIRGSSVNHDGESAGLTVPSEVAQQQVIGEALKNAGVTPKDVGYVEAHGTGTKLGDPIELSALRAALCAGRTNAQPLWVGSAKANIGHLEAAAGVTGLIKAALAIQARRLPPQVNFNEPSPHIQWDDPPVRVPTRDEPFPERAGQRIAGVSAFGMSGTNAHVILAALPDSEHSPAEALPPRAQTSSEATPGRSPATGVFREACLLPISARSLSALNTLSARYARSLAQEHSLDIASFCYSAAVGRAHSRHRRCILARREADVIAGLVARDGSVSSVATEGFECFEGEARTPPRIGLLILPLLPLKPGAETILSAHPAHRRELDAGRGLDIPQGDVRGGALPAPTDLIEAFRHCEATAEMVRSFGLSPVALAGAGSGVALAAHLAGMLPACAAIKWASGAGDPTGSFTRARLPLVGSRDVPACLSAPETLETKPGALQEALEALRAHGTPWVILVGAMGLRLIGSAETIGEQALSNSDEAGYEALRALGRLYAEGANVDWKAVFEGCALRRLVLPTYPFEHQPHWVSEEPTPDRNTPNSTSVDSARSEPPLLGREIPLPGLSERRFETALSWERPRWLSQHVIFGQVLVPGSLSLSLFVEAARAHWGRQAVVLENIQFARALAIQTQRGAQLQLIAVPDGEHIELKMMARPCNANSSEWQLYASARAAAAPQSQTLVKTPSGSRSLSAIRARCTQPDSSERLHAGLAQVGAELGPWFRWHAELSRAEKEILCRMQVPDSSADALSGGSVALDAGLIDSCFQLLAVPAPGKPPLSGVPAPIFVRRLFLAHPGPLHEDTFCHVPDTAIGSFRLLNTANEVLATVDGVSFREVPSANVFSLPEASGSQPERRIDVDQAKVRAAPHLPELYVPSWIERRLPSGSTDWSRRRWLLIADRSSTLAPLARSIQSRGDPVEKWTLPDPSSPGTQQLPLESLHERVVSWLGRAEEPKPGVVYLSGVATPGLEGLESSAEHCSATALTLIQALATTSVASQPALWIVTRGAQAVVTGERMHGLTRAPLWGLATAVPMEEERLRCFLVDLDPREGELSQSEAEELLMELPLEGRDGAVALRSAHRYVKRLVPSAMPLSREPFAIAPHASCLISGGLGGIGLALATLLVERGARHLVLVGRSGATARVQATLKGLRERGATVTYASIDIADRVALDTLLDRIRRELPPLQGVIHAAGVIEDALLRTQSRSGLRRVLSPKVAGAWNLHNQTRGDTLSFFVLFSSIAALCGIPGQGAYAAGNAFLDALAHHRREQGLTATSVNLGAFAQVGMAARQTDTQKLQRATWGFGAMEPGAALERLLRLMKADVAQIGLAHLDVPKLLSGESPYYQLPLFEFLAPKGVRSPQGPIPTTNSDEGSEPARFPSTQWLQEVSALPPATRSACMLEHVKQRLAQTLNMGSSDSIDPELPLVELGVDSLMGVELSNRLGADLGWRLPPTLIFDCPTVNALATELLFKLDAPGTRHETTVTPQPEDGREQDSAASVPVAVPQKAVEKKLGKDWEHLSDEELGSLVDEMVARGT